VLDKTGTLTKGQPSVTNISPVGADIQILASLENLSEHPLAQAIVSQAKTDNIKLLDVTDFKTIPRSGTTGKINKTLYYAGNLKLISLSVLKLIQMLLKFCRRNHPNYFILSQRNNYVPRDQ
jgi:cation transport ATPase